MATRENFWRFALLAAPVSVFAVFVLWPMFDSFRYSLTDWNGFEDSPRFVGLENFRRIFTDPLFFNSLINTAIWMGAALAVPTIGGLALALLLDSRVRGARIFKSIFYLPICLASVVVGQIWIWIFQPDWGLLNEAIRSAGQLSPKQFHWAWLAEPRTALACVILAWSWQQTGLNMVIFLAGLTSIPSELLEAAAIDNVPDWKKTLHIVLPMLRPATAVAVALSMIGALKTFDILYIMTGGGPFHSSDTLALFMYNELFQKYKMGYGSSISVVLFLICVVIIVAYFRQVGKLGEIYD